MTKIRQTKHRLRALKRVSNKKYYSLPNRKYPRFSYPEDTVK